MTNEKKIEMLAEILDVEPEELTPETEIASLEWDSLAVLGFIAMMDSEFDKTISGGEVRAFKTIQDALDVMEA